MNNYASNSTLGSASATVDTTPALGILLGKLDNLVDHFRENGKRLERVTDHTLGGLPKDKPEGGPTHNAPGLIGEIIQRISALEMLAREQGGTLNRLETLA